MTSWQLFSLSALAMVCGVVLAAFTDKAELAAALIGAGVGAIGGPGLSRSRSSS